MSVPEAKTASNLLETFTRREGNNISAKQPYPVPYADMGQFGELLSFPGDCPCTQEENVSFIFCFSVYLSFITGRVLAMTLKGRRRNYFST